MTGIDHFRSFASFHLTSYHCIEHSEFTINFSIDVNHYIMIEVSYQYIIVKDTIFVKLYVDVNENTKRQIKYMRNSYIYIHEYFDKV